MLERHPFARLAAAVKQIPRKANAMKFSQTSLPMIVTFSVMIGGGAVASWANALAMQCGSDCGPMGDTELLRQMGVALCLLGVILLPVNFAVVTRRSVRG